MLLILCMLLLMLPFEGRWFCTVEWDCLSLVRHHRISDRCLDRSRLTVARIRMLRLARWLVDGEKSFFVLYNSMSSSGALSEVGLFAQHALVDSPLVVVLGAPRTMRKLLCVQGTVC